VTPAPARAERGIRPEDSGYLVDNSVLQKLGRSPAILRRFTEVTHSHPIFTCPPQVLEYCWSARTADEHRELRRDMELYTPARRSPTPALVLDVQQALWSSGRVRGAGNADVLIAAYAIANDLTVLSSDHDFDSIERALDGGFRHEFVPE
jgi:predicted nucleic acid-binding protein